MPIYELQNDGRANLLGALLFAGQFVIPEVCLPVKTISETAFLPLAGTCIVLTYSKYPVGGEEFALTQEDKWIPLR